MSELNPPSAGEPFLPQPQPDFSVGAPPPPAPPAVAQPASRPDSGMRLVAGVVTAVILATGGGIAIGWNLARVISNRSVTTAQIHTVAPVTPSPGATAQNAADKVIPAVVDINTVIQTTNSTAAAAGTGLILDGNGDVLTNNHVVDGSVSIKVTVGSGATYTADVVGVDPSADIAVIHLENASNLPTVTWADSSKVNVGDTIYAIGNALGLGGAPRVTQGQVTALDQTITASEDGANAETLNGMIQADAEISPGDSGGALANSAGQVVGIITAGQATSFRTTASNVGFAIPSNTAVDIANKILDGQAGDGIYIGPVGFIGVSVETLDPQIAAQLGLNISSGVVVRGVQSGSPADRAGITVGSVITKVDGTTIDSTDALGTALHAHKPGDQASVSWYLNGATHTSNVTLISGPAI